MTSASVDLTGPARDTRRAYGPTLSALRDAVARSAELWRHIDKPDALAPGLTWTAPRPPRTSSVIFVTTPRH